MVDDATDTTDINFGELRDTLTKDGQRAVIACCATLSDSHFEQVRLHYHGH